MRYLNFIWLLLLASCYANDELPPDQEIWGYAHPEDEGMNQEQLLLTNGSIINGDFSEIRSLIIIKNDNIVFENYYDDTFRSQVRSLGLASSILTVAALGEVINDGYINSLDDPIYQYMPAYFNVFDAQPEKKEITIRHLLNNSSGFTWYEASTSQNSSNDFSKMKNTSDWVGYVIKQELEAPPGIRMVINSGLNMLLSSIMQHALGNVRLQDYIDERILKPINITNYQWESDPSGNLDGATGVSMTEIDFTKLGYLFANYGLWNRKRILNEDWVYEMLSIKTKASPFYDIGYGWRSFSAELASYYGLSGAEIFFTPVDFGQTIYLIPKQNLIITIYAENYFYDFRSPSFSLFSSIFQTTVN
ncbi:MAG: CubicO group peptidase (beta-lactamase class C family) [Cyclobacteriaceae bacterium]|jgi:CubicO group peptidase (beta-lactamase class C family)